MRCRLSSDLRQWQRNFTRRVNGGLLNTRCLASGSIPQRICDALKIHCFLHELFHLQMIVCSSGRWTKHRNANAFRYDCNPACMLAGLMHRTDCVVPLKLETLVGNTLGARCSDAYAKQQVGPQSLVSGLDGEHMIVGCDG